MTALPYFSVNADMFRIVSAFVCKDGTREYLSGVYLQPHPKVGAVLVATDGHVLLAMHDAIGDVSKPVIVPVMKSVLAATKRTKGETTPRSLVGDTNGELSVWSGAPDLRRVQAWPGVEPIDGVFPDWVRIVPRIDRVESLPSQLHLTGHLLQRFIDAAAEMSRCRISDEKPQHSPLFLRLSGCGEGLPALVSFDDPCALGVLMSRQPREISMPNWFKTL